MRFLSPHPGYSVQVFEGEERVEHEKATGQAYTLTVRTPLVADFESGHGLFPHEVELALARFTSVWNGLPENVNPATKIAVYDTEAYKVFKGWSDEYHDAVVKRMQQIADQAPSRLVAVAEAWHPKPWPAYDAQDPAQVIKYVLELGIDPESVRLYEGENAQREEVMEAMKQIASGSYLPTDPDAPKAPALGEDIVAVVEA